MMDKIVSDKLQQIAKARIKANGAEIEHSLKQIAAGNPLGSEPVERRRVERIAIKTGFSMRDSDALSKSIERAAEEIDSAPETSAGPEAIQGPTIDFVGVEFLVRGRHAANAVGRVIFRNGRAQGTGFLVGPDLFLTNNHVIETADAAATMCVEFDYELDRGGQQIAVTTFGFDPARCFVSDPIDMLDFTLIALGNRLSGPKELGTFGFIPMSDARDKHMLGEIANIIQHPQGSLKQIVVRENNIVSRDETNQVLHYIADTEPGASGSPVFNNEWELVALHHWGGPHLEIKDATGKPLRRDINEGIRTSAIVGNLRNIPATYGASTRDTVEQVLVLWDGLPRTGPVSPGENVAGIGQSASRSSGSGQRMESDGSLTWTFPIEINVRAPLLMPAPAPAVATLAVKATPTPDSAERKKKGPVDFTDRDGYEPGFVPGFVLPLPRFNNPPYQIAKNQMAAPGDDPHELRYHHFSIVMNADRRLAAFTACNIDGSRLVAINRTDKSANDDPTLNDLGVEALGAESSDDFSPDPRVVDSEQMTIDFYQEQEVPGFPKPPFPGKDASTAAKKAYARAMSRRTARMFQKGHIIMRGDPAWGTVDAARAAESDTFFYTNAAPQLGYFNQGSPVQSPGAKGKLRWRAVETYVLRNAFAVRQRVCVFAGPVFDDDYDVAYREGVKVPMRFWKIVVWADDDALRAIALLADQKPVLEKLTKGVPEAAENFEDDVELARVSEFLTTVKAIETLTALDFGRAIRRADVHGDAEAVAPLIDNDLSFLRSPRRPQYNQPASRKRNPRG